MAIDLKELILSDYDEADFNELIARIEKERQRRISEKRVQTYDNFIKAFKTLRDDCPFDEIWITVEDEDGNEIDVDLIEAICDNLDKFYKNKNCT